MTTPQSGILPDANQHSLFLLFRRRIGRRASPRIKKLLAQLPERAAQLAATDPAAHFGAVIAFGTNIWNELWEDRPHSLRAFPRISGAVHQAPTTEVDVLLHLRSERYDFLHEFADKLVPELGEWLDMLEVVHGFRYHDGRDLTGFVDGTENPQGEDRAPAALVADGDHAQGSFVSIQRYVHNLHGWETLPTHDQEKHIGRTKEDDQELDDATKPPTAISPAW